MLDVLHTVFENMGVKRETQRLFFRVLWVLAVSGHILWICGFLAGVGLASPFVRAADVEKIEQKVTALERASIVSARINLQQEIRAQTLAYCSLPEGLARDSVLRRIDALRDELFDITQQRGSDPVCTGRP